MDQPALVSDAPTYGAPLRPCLPSVARHRKHERRTFTRSERQPLRTTKRAAPAGLTSLPMPWTREHLRTDAQASTDTRSPVSRLLGCSQSGRHLSQCNRQPPTSATNERLRDGMPVPGSGRSTERPPAILRAARSAQTKIRAILGPTSDQTHPTSVFPLARGWFTPIPPAHEESADALTQSRSARHRIGCTVQQLDN